MRALFQLWRARGAAIGGARIRQAFFEAFAEGDGPGYILTFVWAFELPSEWEYMEGVARIFTERRHEMCWVELEADVDVRLARNRSENRLAHKASKRDLAFSEGNLLKAHEEHRLNSLSGEMPEGNYLRIDNTDLSPEEVARMIRARFLG